MALVQKSFLFVVFLAGLLSQGNAFSTNTDNANRRAFLSKSAAATTGAAIALSTPFTSLPARAATPEVLKTSKGIKYVVTKKPADKASFPVEGDFVVVEYTGYLVNGQIFDATHSEGKSNALLFKLGSTAVINGLNDMVANMKVGEKVQAIIPPELAFGDTGVCLEGGDCLIKPGSTLVYDILLKKTSIPPP